MLVFVVSSLLISAIFSQTSGITFSPSYDFVGNCGSPNNQTEYNASDMALPLIYYCIYGYQLNYDTYQIKFIDSQNNEFYVVDSTFEVSQDEYHLRFFVSFEAFGDYTGDQTFTLKFESDSDSIEGSFIVNNLEEMSVDDTSVREVIPSTIDEYFNKSVNTAIYENGDTIPVNIGESLYLCSVFSNFKDYFYGIFLIEGLDSGNSEYLYQRIGVGSTHYYDTVYCKEIIFSDYFLNDKNIKIESYIRFDSITVDSLSINIGLEFPTNSPTQATNNPTITPSNTPTNVPTFNPSVKPSESPIMSPSQSPSHTPSIEPTMNPTHSPTEGGYCVHKNGKTNSICTSQDNQIACESINQCVWIA